MRRFLLPTAVLSTTTPTGEVKNLVANQTVGTEAASVTITADAIDIEGHRATSVNVAASLAAAGAGGLDTGAEAANTTYFLWLIRKSTDGTMNGLLSLSATAPTMPTGYDQKRLISHRRNDNSSNMIRLFQCNDLVVGHSTGMVVATAISATADLDMTTFVPAAIADFVLLHIFLSGGGMTWAVDDKDDATVRYVLAPASGTTSGSMIDMEVWVRKNASNLVTATKVAGNTFSAYVAGWKVKGL